MPDIIYLSRKLANYTEALIDASVLQTTSISYRNLVESCAGFLLFGVPNLGLNNENLLTLVNGQENEDLFRSLKFGSSELRQLDADFERAYRANFTRCFVISFFETRQTRTVQVCSTEKVLSKAGYE